MKSPVSFSLRGNPYAELRESQKLSARAFAKVCGVHVMTVLRAERDLTGTPGALLLGINRAAVDGKLSGVDLEAFLTRCEQWAKDKVTLSAFIAGGARG